MLFLLSPLLLSLSFLLPLVPLSFLLPLLPFSLLHVANFLVEALVLTLVILVGGIEVHDLVFEFPEGVFDFVLVLLGSLNLGSHLFFVLTREGATYSRSRI